MKRAAWIIFFLIMAVSCLDEPDCFRQDLNLVGISFKKLFDGQADTVEISGIGAQDYKGEFVINSRTVTSLSLPLNYLKNQTFYALVSTERTSLAKEGIEKNYFITLSHQSQIQFVSEDCGERYIVSNLKLLSNTGFTKDSIQFISGAVTNPASNNIIIYRCPRTNIMRFSFRQLFMDTVSRGQLRTRVLDTIKINDSTTPFRVDTITAVSSVLLPLDKAANAISYHFKFSDELVRRTIDLAYKSVKDTVIIERCGAQTVLKEIKAVNPSIDPNFIVEIASDSIHDPPYTNIEAYSCPVTNQIRILFRQNRQSSKVTDTLNLVSLTADFGNFTTNPVYQNIALTNVTLPLNPNSATTKFTFTLKPVGNAPSKVFTLQLGYTREVITFHTRCGSQTRFTNLTLVSSDFGSLTTIDITDADVKFPTVNNITLENIQ